MARAQAAVLGRPAFGAEQGKAGPSLGAISARGMGARVEAERVGVRSRPSPPLGPLARVLRDFWRGVRFCRSAALVALLVALLSEAGSAALGAEPAQTPAPGETRGLAWQVRSGKGRLTLFGSIRVARKDTPPLAAAVQSAYESAEALVVELNGLRHGAQEFGEAAHYPAGQTLKAHVSDSTYLMLAQAMRRYGVPMRRLAGMRPWAVAVQIDLFELRMMGLRVESGADAHFLVRADSSGKPIVEMETPQDQFGVLRELPDDVQEQFLRYLLQSLQVNREASRVLFEAWARGDAETFQKIWVQTLDVPELGPLKERVVGERNRRITRKLEGYLKAGHRYFVVVGADQLLGPGGILEVLRARGFRPEPLGREGG